MHRLRQTPAGDRRQPSTLPTDALHRRSYAEEGRNSISGLRQIDDFSVRLKKIRRSGTIYALALLALTFICVNLFLKNVNIVALFSAGAVVLIIQIVAAGTAYFNEEKRTVEAYWHYLDSYSIQVIMALQKSSQLSDWSRIEINRYLMLRSHFF